METILDYHALTIGIDTYTGGVAPLQSAVKDAEAIAKILREKHGYSVTSLMNTAATSAAIFKHLNEVLPSTLHEESGFLLYFAGHGIALGDGTEGPQGYLLPQDGVAADEDSWLSMQTLRTALEALPCRHLFVVLDCCFAGSFRWASTRRVSFVRPLYDSQFARYISGDAWQALTSASHDEEAVDVVPGRRNLRDTDDLTEHSPFAAALIRGLSGAADSARGDYKPDGVITATELYQYVFEELTPPGAEPTQTPGIWSLKADNKGEFVFKNPQIELNTLPDPPLDDDNNPWMGLESYSSEHSSLYFGREEVIDKLLERVLGMGGGCLLAVVGASGTGKSSVVKAGLIPRLADPPDHARERVSTWTIIESERLRRHPVQQLDHVLDELASAPVDNKKLVFIDQFEELYTQCRDENMRRDYLQRLRKLIDRSDGPIVVVTIRTDFEPRPAGSDEMQDLWQSARFVVPTFSSDELRDVIEGPARVKALYFEPAELVGTLLDEITAMPGALPLLSFALAEMYRHAQIRRRETGAMDRALTQEDYEAIGGVVGALHRRATLLYNEADKARQVMIKRVFLRMLSHDGARLTRRRVDRAELTFSDPNEQHHVDAMLVEYTAARLLVVDGEHIEPAHDTLVMAWHNLQEWLAESGPQDLIRAIWLDARNWEENHRKGPFLWNANPRLQQAKLLSSDLNSLESAFVKASALRKSRRFLTIVGMVLVVIAGLALATYNANQAREAADDQRDEARKQLALTQWRNGVYVRENQQPVRAAHWFAKAVDSPDKNLGNAARLAATHAIRGARLKNIIRPQGIALETVTGDSAELKNPPALKGGVLSEDGRILLSYGDYNALFVSCLDACDNCGDDGVGIGTKWVWVDATTGEPNVLGRDKFIDEINKLPKRSPKPEDIELPGDQSLIWGEPNTVGLQDTFGGKKTLLPLHHPESVRGGVYQAGKSRFITWGDDGYLRSWLITAKRSELLDEGEKKLLMASPKPCEKRERELLEKSLNQLGRNVSSVSCVKYEDDDLLSWENWTTNKGIKNNTVRLWRILPGNKLEQLGPVRHHKGQVLGAVLSKDHSRILSWSADKSVRLWERDNGDSPLVEMDHKAKVVGARFNSNESLVLSWGDKDVRLWNVESGEEVISSLRHLHGVDKARFNGAETAIETWDHGNGGQFWSWDLSYDSSASGEEISLMIQRDTGTRLNESAELEIIKTPSEHDTIKKQLENPTVCSPG